MAGSRRLVQLLARGSTVSAKSKLGPGVQFARHFVQPASNADEYKRFASAKERAHVSVRTQNSATVWWRQTETALPRQWPEFCNRPLAAVDPEMVRSRGPCTSRV
jgi:hypothetical protein